MSLTPPDIVYVDKYYYNGNHFQTHVLTALSSLFPEGERFFMKSLTPYIKEYPDLEDDIKQFAREENAHTAAHIKLNRLIDNINRNSAVKYLEDKTGRVLNPFYKLPQSLKVLITESLEHITYSLCNEALSRTVEFKEVKDDAYKLYIYHCIEEVSPSHSSIAGRVYQKTQEDTNLLFRNIYSKIRQTMIIPVTIILSIVVINYINYLYKINDDFEYIDFIRGVNKLMGYNGWVRKALIKSIKTWE